MSVFSAQAIWTIVSGYVLLGVVVAVPFVLRGAARLDSRAGGGSVGFRLIILPAAVALWPWVLQRWLSFRRASESRGDDREAER